MMLQENHKMKSMMWGLKGHCPAYAKPYYVPHKGAEVGDKCMLLLNTNRKSYELIARTIRFELDCPQKVKFKVTQI